LKWYVGIGSGFGTQTSHVASVMTPNVVSTSPQAQSSLPSTTNSIPCSSSFSSNPFWIPPNLSHSIFSTQVVDRTAYKYDSWIIDTGATDHMVYSVTQFTSITSIVNTCVSHVGTVHISSTLVLTDVLRVPSFGFNLISMSKLTKTLFCCLMFLGHCCFVQDLD